MHRPLFIPFLLILTACSSGPYPVTSPYYQIPAGSKLVLNEELTIPPNNGRVYIQNGNVITPKEKNQYYPHCWFLSWKVPDTAQQIKPDTFYIVATRKSENVVRADTPLRLASALAVSGLLGNASITSIEFTTEMWLQSEKQPDIRRLICSHWENPEDGRHLTVAEMQKTLGNIAEIQINK